MKRVGAHVSIKDGVHNAPLNAAKINAMAFALFTRNQRQWKAKALDTASVAGFKEHCLRGGFRPEHILPHASYLINLGSPEKEILTLSRSAFLEELGRCEELGLMYLVFHPGNHKNGMSEEECLSQIAGCIDEALEKTSRVSAVVENTAGQGSSVGYCFEHIAFLMRSVSHKDRFGVCLDTCHMFSAGYEIRTLTSYRETMKEFDRVVGFEYLKGMHLNDSKGRYADRKDRHQSLGEGEIGLEPFRWIMNDSRLEEIPLILETPDPKRWPREIELLYSY